MKTTYLVKFFLFRSEKLPGIGEKNGLLRIIQAR